MQEIKGSRIEEQIISVDKILHSMKEMMIARKDKVIIPPLPLSSYNENHVGDIFNYMFRVGGRLSNPMIFVGEIPKEGLILSLNIFNGVVGRSQDLVVRGAKVNTFVVDEVINPGDMLSVKLAPMIEGGEFSKIWFSILFYPESDLRIEYRRIENEGVPA